MGLIFTPATLSPHLSRLILISHSLSPISLTRKQWPPGSCGVGGGRREGLRAAPTRPSQGPPAALAECERGSSGLLRRRWGKASAGASGRRQRGGRNGLPRHRRSADAGAARQSPTAQAGRGSGSAGRGAGADAELRQRGELGAAQWLGAGSWSDAAELFRGSSARSGSRVRWGEILVLGIFGTRHHENIYLAGTHRQSEFC